MADFPSSNIAITGSTGFLGTHLTRHLKNLGYQTHAVNLREDWSSSLSSYDCLIHLAGKAHDLKGTGTEEDFFKANVGLTEQVYKHFLNSDAKLFIHISSIAAVEDTCLASTLTEETAPHPSSHYGRSKLQAEKVLLSYKLPSSKRLVILRPAMVHGPGDKGNIRLLFKVISKGIPYPFAAFKNQRTFLSVDNFCFAIEQIISKQVPSGIYNLVDDESVSTLEIIDLMGGELEKQVMKIPVPKFIINLLGKLGDILGLPINSTKILKLTGNYQVSNTKIKQALGIAHFPVAARDGLIKTVRSLKT